MELGDTEFKLDSMGLRFLWGHLVETLTVGDRKEVKTYRCNCEIICRRTSEAVGVDDTLRNQTLEQIYGEATK